MVFFKLNLTLSFCVVGTNVGEIAIWDVGTKERLAHKVFKVWEIGSCSLPMQVCHLFHAVIQSHGLLIVKYCYLRENICFML
jgi:hypothetical protein